MILDVALMADAGRAERLCAFADALAFHDQVVVPLAATCAVVFRAGTADRIVQVIDGVVGIVAVAGEAPSTS